MPKTRRCFSAEFKARIALDALSGEHALSDLPASTASIPIMFPSGRNRPRSKCRGVLRQAQTNQQSDEARIKEFHAKIGQLTMETNFLQQAFIKI